MEVVKRRQYDSEFKRQAVKLCLDPNYAAQGLLVSFVVA